MPPKEIKARCRAIGLQGKALAHLSGLHETTVERTLNGKTEPLSGTLEKLTDALIAEEHRLRDDLIDLHGLPDRAAFVIGGVARRVVQPCVDVKETA
jgi:transcriptional regulator with XRE-family HTH domain